MPELENQKQESFGQKLENSSELPENKKIQNESKSLEKGDQSNKEGVYDGNLENITKRTLTDDNLGDDDVSNNIKETQNQESDNAYTNLEESTNSESEHVSKLKNKISTLKLAVAGLSILAVVLISTLILVGFGSKNPYYATINNQNTKSKIEILNLIKENYTGESPSQEKIAQGELRGLVSSLEDPYSAYINTEDGVKLRDDLNRRYEGIGVVFDQDSKGYVIQKVLKSGPAEKSGLKTRDRLKSVNDKEIKESMAFEEVAKIIRGEAGTSVKIGIERDGVAISFDMVRQKLEAEIIELEKIEDIGIIRVYSFGDNLGQKMEEIAKTIKSDNQIKRLVIDVMGDGGGLLSECVKLSSYFLKPGSVLLKEKDKSGETEVKSEKVEDGLELYHYPLLVLTDNYSASASEILTAALKENRNIKSAGKKTFGKGTVQKIFPLESGGELKLTIAEWLSPKGNQINKKGVDVDFKIDSVNNNEVNKLILENPNWFVK